MLKIFLNSKNQQFLVKHKKIDCYLTQTNRHFHPNLYVRQLPQRLSFRTVKTSYSQLFYILCRSVQGTCNWIFINARFNDILQQLTMLIKSGEKDKEMFPFHCVYSYNRHCERNNQHSLHYQANHNNQVGKKINDLEMYTL